MTRNQKVFLFLVIICKTSFSDIIDNTTTQEFRGKSPAKRRAVQGRPEDIVNSTTPRLLSTRADFLSASTVLNPPESSTRSAALNFGWRTRSNPVQGGLTPPWSSGWRPSKVIESVNRERSWRPETGRETAGAKPLWNLGTETESLYPNWTKLNRPSTVTEGDQPYPLVAASEYNRENSQRSGIARQGIDNYKQVNEPRDWTLQQFRRWIRLHYLKKQDDPTKIPEVPKRVLEAQRTRGAEQGVPPSWEDKVLTSRVELTKNERQDIYTEDPQHNNANTSEMYENEVSSYYVFPKLEKKEDTLLLADEVPTTESRVEEFETTEVADNTTHLRHMYTEESSTSSFNKKRIEELSQPQNASKFQNTPVSEALHSPDQHDGENISHNHSKGHLLKSRTGTKVLQEPMERDSMIEKLTSLQFSWVDVIIAVCSTAATLLLLINLGVCIQYCLQKKTSGKRFRPYTLPLSAGLRLSGGSRGGSPVRKLRPRNRPWINYHRSFMNRHRIMWPSTHHSTHDSTSTDVSMLSLHSTEKGTQYENSDAMIANFVNSDLIVELNDRDSTCTSISDGFTFSREYGSPKPLHSSVTDL